MNPIDLHSHARKSRIPSPCSLRRAPRGSFSSAAFRLALGATLILCAVGCAGGNDAGDPDSGLDEPVAITTSGPVRGAVQDGIYTFKGIRYGADTADHRFAAPQSPKPWTDVREATSFGASCPQTPTGNPGGLFTSWRPDPVPPLDEDCLFLNVWTPGLDEGAARPVMVWLHGGGFSSGNGSSRAYDGTRLARRGDVVVITVNHRLNAFGYLDLSHYGEGFEDSPTAGILDLVLALEWVRDNVARFGGDSETVTIFGESGGGAKVSTLLAMEGARGLFHRAIIQSGAMSRFIPAEDAQAAADQVVAALGLTPDTIDEIRSLPADAVREALEGTGAATAPALDGHRLTHHPFDPVAAPAGAQVPLMLGSNRTEISLFLGPGSPELLELSWDGLDEALARTWPDRDTAAIIAEYRRLQPDSDPSDIYLEALTDARYLAGHVLLAERKAEQGGAPAYLYLFNWDTPVDGGKWRSPHALEIGFVFDNVANSESMSGVGEEQQRVADVMADTWIAFARNGKPDHPGIPAWPPYDLERRATMVLDATPELVDDARGAQRALVDDVAAYLRRYRR